MSVRFGLVTKRTSGVEIDCLDRRHAVSESGWAAGGWPGGLVGGKEGIGQ